jgi:hypothetical protein
MYREGVLIYILTLNKPEYLFLEVNNNNNNNNNKVLLLRRCEGLTTLFYITLTIIIHNYLDRYAYSINLILIIL